MSSGPKTAAGKARSSVNAVKTGLTGRTVLLPTDDAAVYEKHIARFFDGFQPNGDAETELVQRMADTQWRLYRIPEIEAGIYALARIQFADLFASHPPAEAAALLQAHTFLTYQKQLNNLSVQEARLHRQFSKDSKELRQLQEDRRAMERRAAQRRPTAANAPARNGFEFSNAPDPLVPAPEQPEFLTAELTRAA